MSGRKTRRKIKRRKRNKHRLRTRGFVENLTHFFLKGRVTDKYTKITTLMIIVLELYWTTLDSVWFAVEMWSPIPVLVNILVMLFLLRLINGK